MIGGRALVLNAPANSLTNVAMPAFTTHPAPGTTATIEARSRSGTCSFSAGAQQPLLYDALHAGVAIPYECATGTCGTCKARRISGVIVTDWQQAPGTAYLKPDRDEVLLCQTRALSDSTFEIPGNANLSLSPTIKPCYGEGVVGRIERLTHDVAVLWIEMEQPVEFIAGQFAVLRTPNVGGYRAYSMVNRAGSNLREIEFVIKRKPGGGFTEWLFSRAARGDRLDWFGPLGKATFLPSEQRTIICIAGGSGIASIMSILEVGCAARHFDYFDASVFFGVKTHEDVFYLDRLNAFAELCPRRLSITVALSHDQPSEELRRRYPSLVFDAGFPHEIAARDLADRFAGRVAYIAGPPILVDVSIRMLITRGRLPARDIRFDKFS